MFCDNNYSNAYYNVCSTENVCLSAYGYFKSFREATRSTAVCSVPAKKMGGTEDPVEVLKDVWQIMCTLIPIVMNIALARVIAQKLSSRIKENSFWRFVLEFILITVPTVISINVINESVQYWVAIMGILLLFVIRRTNCLKKAAERTFFVGSRPYLITLCRVSTHFFTAYCILAVDFETFPKNFRKTRYYGVGLMDVGIGLFVFGMGCVSKPPRLRRDILIMLRNVTALLVVGILRTAVIMAIDYHQDEHEYGTHLNAFFTLGLTKLFGALTSCLAKKNSHLLFLGTVILVVHEILLQLGVADFVMDDYTNREGFVVANREGLFSLSGFIALYLLSMYLGCMWRAIDSPLNFTEFIKKVGKMGIFVLITCVLTVGSICTINIARVTCNFGYVVWVLSVISIMGLLYTIVFDIVLNTLYPIEDHQKPAYIENGERSVLLKSSTHESTTFSSKYALPLIVEAINVNGMIFFLVANVLTGFVNIFLSPEIRTNFEGYVILCVYMFLATNVVYILYNRNIRIV